MVAKKGSATMKRPAGVLSDNPGAAPILPEAEERPAAPLARTFIAQVTELDSWVRANDGRLPWQSASSKDERRLKNFISEQRKALRQGRLCAERREQLSHVPGMLQRLERWDDEASKYLDFWKQADVLEAWVIKRGDLPRQKSADSTEAKLARFLNKLQRSAANLPMYREERLRRIPGMAKRLARWSVCKAKPFEERVLALEAWMRNHPGQLPTREGKDVEAHGLGKFLSAQQYLHSHGELSRDRADRLLQVPGIAALMHRWEHGTVNIRRGTKRAATSSVASSDDEASCISNERSEDDSP